MQRDLFDLIVLTNIVMLLARALQIMTTSAIRRLDVGCKISER